MVASGFDGLLRGLWRQRGLIARLVRREFEARYRGSFLGLAWAALSPLALVLVYAFVFHAVLAVRWPGAAAAGATTYALNLFVGLLAFNLLAEVLGRAPRLILENPGYVKKVVFPLEILPLVAVASAALAAAIGGGVLVALHLALGGMPHLAWGLAPMLALPLLLWSLALAYLLAALGVFLRDIAQLTGPLTMALLFLSPVFYPASQVPPPWGHWLALSPLSAGIEWLRGAILLGTGPDPGLYAAHLGVSLLALAAGAFVFARLARGFADVI